MPHPIQALRLLSPSLQGTQPVAGRLVLIICTRILGLLPRNVGSPGRSVFVRGRERSPEISSWGRTNVWDWRGWGGAQECWD